MRRFVLLVAGLALFAGVASAVSGGATQAHTRWVITDLGTLGGAESGIGSYSYDYFPDQGGINDLGQIAGWADMKEDRTGFLWENGKMRAIGLYPVIDINERGQVLGESGVWGSGKVRSFGEGFQAGAFNNQGQIAGWGHIGKKNKFGDPIDGLFLWERGRIRYLGAVAGGFMEPQAINERGQIVGRAEVEKEFIVKRNFVWADGKFSDLGPRFSIASPAAVINNRGQIPGSARPFRAAIWHRGRIRLLPTRQGLRGVAALDVNEVGMVVGACTAGGPTGAVRPCLWQDGTVRAIDLAYGDVGKAVAVNDYGQVIGNSRTGSGKFHAFVWDKGRTTDLGTLPGGKESVASAINERGQIIGWAETKSGDYHAVLWTLKRG